MMNRKLYSAMLLGVGLIVMMGVSACASSDTTASGSFDPTTQEFAPCPDSPNCVSTAATDERHAIDPYVTDGSASGTKARILNIINAMPRSTIIVDEDNYLHVEFRSRIFRFVDDVEFYFDEADGLVQFRSASRTGDSDMGVNRKRMEEIRTSLGQ